MQNGEPLMIEVWKNKTPKGAGKKDCYKNTIDLEGEMSDTERIRGS